MHKKGICIFFLPLFLTAIPTSALQNHSLELSRHHLQLLLSSPSSFLPQRASHPHSELGALHTALSLLWVQDPGHCDPEQVKWGRKAALCERLLQTLETRSATTFPGPGNYSQRVGN